MQIDIKNYNASITLILMSKAEWFNCSSNEQKIADSEEKLFAVIKCVLSGHFTIMLFLYLLSLTSRA